MSSKFPFYKQLDEVDCGPTCLQMICKFYGKYFLIENLRSLCYMSKEGISLLNIKKASEKLGFNTVAGKFTFSDLLKINSFPCIIMWKQSHYVVIYKVKQKDLKRNKQAKVYVADPAYGLMSYTETELKKNWIVDSSNEKGKGIALLFEPTEYFFNNMDSDSEPNGLKFLFHYFLRYKKFFTKIVIGIFLSSLLQLVFPFLTQAIVDIGIRQENIKFIYIILLGQFVLVISRMSVDFIRNWLLLHISARINISMVSDFFIKLMKLPMAFFDAKKSGDILQRIDDHMRVENFLTTKSFEAIFSVFSLLIFSFVLLSYSFKIFAIFIVFSFLYLFWIIIHMPKRQILDYKFFDIKAANQSKTYQLIQGMQEIKLQNIQKSKRWDWEDVQADLFKANIISLNLEQKIESGKVLINETKNILITIIAAISVMNNEMTLGMMLSTQYILGQLTLPIEQVMKLIYDFQDTNISLKRINELHKKKDENDDIRKHSVSTIKIEKLVFQYEGPLSKKVLNSINVIIPKGKVTAIVGSSGSGKTTLIKLLLQYYKPIEGNILIDNLSLSKINTDDWRDACGVVMQDGFIFSESIAQNITSTDDEIDNNRLIKAAKIANIHSFIMSLALKYETVIGQEGQNLSQGQRQRVLIARAVYKNPDFLFLDEATNALDANNEKAIIENLQEFYKGKTVIVVAHRLSTVKNADQIIVLDNGQIAEFGDHKELTNKKGAYYNLVKNQLELGN
jgi:ATP-binding cassette subfamily B protein